ncbi:hypothetical protein KFL_002870160 [Klebsormidium nitens]|uniref:SGF29 C-terminal domain-containing protein n=1 Tax=Klebsormidium nitens TaxID=105231 RepID=A0A1Y1I8Y7_KLENI|nr:hypothetical protein KFL_002870160 [Klebsormidium nitens]|eukprot:GAQ86412.1 hypothetical protein KFL_002870160 [Klebsormidium nitens]
MAILSASALRYLQELESCRRAQDGVLRKINKIHLRLGETDVIKAEKFKEELWSRLRGFYVEARELAEREEKLAGHCMQEIQTQLLPGQLPPLKQKHEPSEKKRKVKTEGSNRMININGDWNSPSPSPRSRDSPNVVIGEQVSARVSPDDAPADEWILVKVTKYDAEGRRYWVVDEEVGENAEPRRYVLPAACIIALPKPTQSEANRAPEYPPGSMVLAVYPGTTALYRARVAGSPRKKKTDDYLLEFDDDEEPGVEGLPKRPVPFHHVVPLPPTHRK